MAGRYGISFAKTLVEEGNYEEAILAATREIDGGNHSPELFADRASAFELTERFAEAVSDFERAIALDATEKVLERDLVDDAYFSALLACAREEVKRSVADGVRRLDQYAHALPAGNHLSDAIEWQKRLRGELVSTLDKTRDK